MSLHYEFVLACELRRDTPNDHLNLLRWHLGLGAGRPAGAEDEPLLTPQRDTYLPGGEFAALTDHGGSWGLFYRGFWLDDAFYEALEPVFALLAPYAVDGYAGHFREELATLSTTICVRDGVVSLLGGPVGGFRVDRPGSGLVIREAGELDDPARVCALLRHLAPGDEQPEPERLAEVWPQIIAAPGRALVLALRGDDLIGSVDLVLVPNLTHQARPYLLVENLVVHPGHRRRGVAKALLAAAVDHARKSGCYKVQLLSNAKRTEAHPLYEAAGFTASAKGFRRYL